jgi:hypothetical protein
MQSCLKYKEAIRANFHSTLYLQEIFFSANVWGLIHGQ